jgi:hypothetical protein
MHDAAKQGVGEFEAAVAGNPTGAWRPGNAFLRPFRSPESAPSALRRADDGPCLGG